ncbi:UDP-Glycosyltransferase/glycogen phosphorylase [Trametes gibbosa]|nr:UDP-Glycosyltransferase/glycogen phosphorylase [Trametes gibbosa]
MDAAPQPKHAMLFAAHVWGHTRPMCTLAARLVRLRPATTVTFFAASKFHDRIQVEIAREFGPRLDPAADPLVRNIRLVLLDAGNDVVVPAVLEASFLSAWEGLLAGRPITYTSVDGAQAEWRLADLPPNVVVIDVFTLSVFETFFERRGEWKLPVPLKLYSWLPVATSWALLYWRQDQIPRVTALAAEKGISFREAAYEFFMAPKGNVLESPCLPPVYDYECHPQAMPLPPDVTDIVIKIGWTLQNTDGVLTFDAADYHASATTALREWFGASSRSFCFAGPLVPPSDAKSLSGWVSSPGAEPVFEFLDRMLAVHGKRSVIYVSFGSGLWPSDLEKLDAVLDTIMSRGLPILMSQPPVSVLLLESTRTKLAEYDNMCSSPWIPQPAVLNHPAIAWFLTHGGHNSVLESIVAGVPMIVWPITIDQPPNAVHLTHNLDVAYELFEVRHGSGLGKVYRTGQTPRGTIEAVKAEMNGVLDRALGADGEEKRARLRGLSVALRGAWEDGGVARREMEGFLDGL